MKPVLVASLLVVFLTACSSVKLDSAPVEDKSGSLVGKGADAGRTSLAAGGAADAAGRKVVPKPNLKDLVGGYEIEEEDDEPIAPPIVPEVEDDDKEIIIIIKKKVKKVAKPIA